MPSPTLVPRIGPARLARAIGREAALVALSLVVGALSFGAMLTFVDEAGATGIRIELLLLLDAAAGLLGIAILPLRRFAPLAVAAVLGVIAAVSSIGLLASGIALVSLAIRRRPKEIAAAAAVWIAAVGTWEVAGLSYLPVTPEELPLTAALILVVLGLLILLGLYLGGRRELLASLRERARLAEEEQALRSAQAADRERTRIAREMHDVLAHRLSLVALHAGRWSTATTSTRQRSARPPAWCATTPARPSPSCAACWGCCAIRRARPPRCPRNRRSPTSPRSSTRPAPSASRCTRTSTPAPATTCRGCPRPPRGTPTAPSRSA
ncbi:Histidine kinase [Clavibacter michiganensis subsp. michiganensis]|uniref:histidine kinase n=1 Tax=Clavibacter michiganensis TaxID=28447 RepID=UPI000B6CDE42|nr:histidine kinase [Clavibacter michiganensis]OUD81961.1 Histidine kinase [Clavibacter michiganensis subsp. michiganensis]